MAHPDTVHIMVKCFIVFRIVGKTSHKSLEFKETVQIQIFPFIGVDFFHDRLQAVLRIKDGRLIHVVPEALDPLIQKKTVLISKPVPRLGIEHIRE